MVDWVRENHALLWWLGAVSAVTFVGTLILVPIVVARIPTDYFARRRRTHLKKTPDGHSVLRVAGLILKNACGVVFVLAGLAMLPLPGQGIITILIGLMLLDFPGKFAMERRLVRLPAVLKAINWMRSRSKRPPLQPPWRRGDTDAVTAAESPHESQGDSDNDTGGETVTIRSEQSAPTD